VLLVVEDVVLVDSFHVLVLILESAADCLGVPFQMLSEGAVVGAFQDVNQSFYLYVRVDFVGGSLLMIHLS